MSRMNQDWRRVKKNALIDIEHQGSVENMTTINTIHDIGIASQIGKYSDRTQVTSPHRLSFVSGLLGSPQMGTYRTHSKSKLTRPGEMYWRC